MRVRYSAEVDGAENIYYDTEVPFVPHEGMEILGLPAFQTPFLVCKSFWMHDRSFLLVVVKDKIKLHLVPELEAAGWKSGVAYTEKWGPSSLVKAGLQRARNEGKRLGRPRLKVNRRLFLQMVKNGASLSEIAAAFRFSKATAHRCYHQFVRRKSCQRC